MRRLIAACLASLLIAGFIAPATGAAEVRAASSVPKVVVIVGPAGSATTRYRDEARKAAALARRYTPDVTEVYSPDATWPAVKAALQGASVVIYMGHGNGWPSKYRDSLYPPTQNGFGLNPQAGGGDATHQYFGESRIARSIQLAPDAVVLLNHLCYASGLSEPGVVEGTLDQAKQRVDNFAAGFIKAGAAAVIAEAYASPNHMLTAVLGGRRSIETAWRTAPTRNGNVFGFRSERSRGYVAQMDPEHGNSGFSRSIVLKEGLASSDVLRGARGSIRSTPIDVEALVPSLARAGITVKQPALNSTAAGAKVRYRFGYRVKERDALPGSIMASVRWDALDPVAADPSAEAAATPSPSPSPAPAPTPEPTPSPTPTATPSAATEVTVTSPSGTATPAPLSAPSTPDAHAASSGTPPATTSPGTSAEPAASASEAPASATPAPTPEPTPEATEAPVAPDLGLVTPEVVGAVVAPVKVKVTKGAMTFNVAAPTTPGRYRLTVTLHDKDGVAYDPATQALLPTLIVRVTGELDAEIVAPARAELPAGGSDTLALWIANLGRSRWGHGAIVDGPDPEGSAPAAAARVTGQWVALDASSEQIEAAAAATGAGVDLPAGLEPGAVVPADIAIYAPTAPGEYLLVLDIVTPDDGSIVATGLEPTVVRVTVTDPAPPTPTPAPTLAPTPAPTPTPEVVPGPKRAG